ncbi:uncharacterized protein E0L32_009182 [Thyridium curvatum]|uniref:Ribosome assembly protein 3 n=1 Tax=Thyridium curvatum TaxID=1093900 RepID=A0A507AXC9_9PEZI|nr:uncharacterized protein E0L32_009182 [Thyridium curvatum]TPX09581.1 hypothetical protein E0L32_009182 [Thyridium curvatum]
MSDSAQSPEPPTTTAATTSTAVSDQFTSFYLQRATREFAEDLDRVRAADDFRNDALPMLVKALQQGTAMFTPEQQRAIVSPPPSAKPAAAAEEPGEQDGE